MVCIATDYIYYVHLNVYCQIYVIESINNFLEMNTHHPHVPIHTHTTCLDYSYFSDLKAFRKYKLQYPKNSVVGYLNINSLRNKIFGL